MTTKPEDNTKPVVFMFSVVAVFMIFSMMLEFNYTDLAYFIFTIYCLIRFLFIKHRQKKNEQ